MMGKAILAIPGEPLRAIEFVDDLEFYYEHLGCDLIDIVRGGDYLIIVDDEGLLVGEPQLNEAASVLYGSPLFGAALIVKEGYTEIGEAFCEGLSDEDIHNFIVDFMKLVRR